MASSGSGDLRDLKGTVVIPPKKKKKKKKIKKKS